MDQGPVFFDPSGKRRKTFTRASAGLGLFLGVAATLFAISLLVVPFLPQIPGLSGHLSALDHHAKNLTPIVPSRETRLARFLLKESRLTLWKDIAQSHKKAQAPTRHPGEPIVAAFYATWQETGRASLRANADKLTHLMPEWLHLKEDGKSLNYEDFDFETTPHNEEIIAIAHEHGLHIHPILNNAENGVFDGARVHKLLTSAAAREGLVHAITKWLLENRFQGLNVDFENLNEEDYKLLPAFYKQLGVSLHKSGLALSTDLEAGSERAPWTDIAGACDFVILMAYDEHYQYGEPGPVASIGWYYKKLENALDKVPANKLVLGLANYAYDWTAGKKGANALSYEDALITARDYRDGESPRNVIDFDSDALNPTFEYEDDKNKAHEVWMLDAVTSYNQWTLAKRSQIAGAALWVLGNEDPSVWKFLNKKELFRPPAPQILQEVSFPFDLEFEGDGEVLSVLSTPKPGTRKISVDVKTGLCTDSQYTAYPFSYVLKRSGFHKKWLVLTFDDGPDAKYTPEVLDLLKDLHVPATFFVIGENAERNPGLLTRMWDEGHEIGSHTFTHPNLNTVSDRRVELELNATQRAIQSILGRSTLLFRPPYNADAEPETAEDVLPIIKAASLNYVTIGELLDPADWNTTMKNSAGVIVPRTAEDIALSAISRVHAVKDGNVLLLHDGGGDRTNTVIALRIIIPTLKKEGYHFATVADLMGVSRDDIMPKLRNSDLLVVGFDRLSFEIIFTFEKLLGFAFVIAIALGIARVAFVTILAFIAHIKSKRSTWSQLTPPVSVVIAAYDEERVIARTINSVLNSDYDNIEVIVVDDGSRDSTSEDVQRFFGNDSRVHLARQENLGKGAALNQAISLAKGEVIVGIDADTQLASDAIALLVRHFGDGKVGAVAGNVKVGNRHNALTKWQALEYITSQNLDRRAYALVNAVTVCPGALGAWRKSALEQCRGYETDTLAEDMDLTWRLRKNGWRTQNESGALCFTEAPDSFRGFFRQRFRWAYGTLQCLWKHRKSLFKHGWFGWMALPTLWLFQVAFQVLAPLIDLQILYALLAFSTSWISRGIYRHDWQPLPEATHMLVQTGFFFALFFVAELIGSLAAFRLDKEKPGLLWWLFWQRFVYRQMMYAVVWKSLVNALRGAKQGWGKLERKGTVRVPTDVA